MNMERESHEETISRVEAILRDFPYGSVRDSQTSASTITINAGGAWHAAAVWIASLCSIVSLLALVLGAVGMSHYISAQDDKLSRMQDYLNAIYAVAPQLKPKEPQ
jgi:hypothetical protein